MKLPSGIQLWFTIQWNASHGENGVCCKGKLHQEGFLGFG